MKSIWFWLLSLPVALLVWWVSVGDRRVVVARETPQALQPGRQAGVGRANEFDGPPGDLSSIRTDLVATPSRLQVRSLLGGQPTAVLTVASSLSGTFLQARPTNGGLDQGPTVTQIDDRNFRVEVRVAEGLAEGTHVGYVELKTCQDAACANEIPRGTLYVPFEVIVEDPANIALGEWETFQRDAGHTGYVPATFHPRAFAYKWEWRRPAGGSDFINAVATTPGLVFVSDDDRFTSMSLRALRETDGSLVWQQTFQDYPALNPPATANGKVYVTTTGHDQTFLWAFHAGTGMAVLQNTFSTQWQRVLAPTIRDGRVYTNGGYGGGGVYAFHDTAGDLQWSMFSGDDDMTTPAVDQSRVYHYDGTALVTYDTATGLKLSSTSDPYNPEQDYSHHGAPMLGLTDSVTTFSGGAFSGYASSSVEQYDSRPLINFSVADNAIRWITFRSYMTQPATAKGIVYAGSNAPKSFNAIDEVTGQVLWSWVPQPSDLGFHRNVVVTDNLVFVSTDRAVYALDLTTHQPVWSYPAPGMLAISGGGTLYIVEGARVPTGRLIAIALK
ncbi:MAG: PQQ-binding-like beta-propeller repeat protein [Xanthomonadales bacterium]|nr:PQQ-binding-like beta-propeller repeat protein [Xanthomonadales bacterium]